MSAAGDRAAAGGLTRTTGTGPLRGLAGLTGAELRRWFPGRAIAWLVVSEGAMLGLLGGIVGVSLAAGLLYLAR